MSAVETVAAALPLLHETLIRIADEARHAMIVTDAAGWVLWRDTRREPAGIRHRWTDAACPVHEPDAGAVIGAVDLVRPAPGPHPTIPALVVAAARLAESLLAAQQAMRDELLLVRHLPLLDGSDGEPAALLALTGRVLASRPTGWLPARVAVASGLRIHLDDAEEAVLHPLPGGWLLRSSS